MPPFIHVMQEVLSRAVPVSPVWNTNRREQMGGKYESEDLRSDYNKLTELAENRLKELAKGGTMLLFACEKQDRKSLESHLARTPEFTKDRISLVDSADPEAVPSKIRDASVVVAFTNGVLQTKFLDDLADKVLLEKKRGIHVHGLEGAQIPAKIVAYRWPSMTWEKLVSLLTA